MANTVDKVIKIAEAEVGYLEKRNGADLYSKTANAGAANYTKYGYEMHKAYPAVMDYPAYWCFTKGTMVLTEHGYVDISMLKVGDKVLSAFGTHFNTVVNTMAHEDDIYELRAVGTLPTYSTKDHPYVAKKRLHFKKDDEFSEIQFFPVNELDKGDSVAMCMTKIVNELELSYNDAWLIGYYVGDGRDSNGKLSIYGNGKRCEKIENYAPGLFKKPMHENATYQKYELTEQQSHLFNILKDCGLGASDRKVPASILYANNNIKQAFLDGYLTANDTSEENKFSTASKELVFGICKLATDLGYGTSMYQQKGDYEYVNYDEDSKVIFCSDVYYGYINNSGNVEHGSHNPVVEGYSFHTIKSVDSTGFKDTVYNITTDGDHTYVANNMSVHNCDCFVDWCFYKAYGVSNAKKLLGGNFEDYTVNSAQLYKNKGAYYRSNPKVGDQIFFHNGSRICHTGLVYKVDSSRVYTIEGNTSGGSYVIANGGGVVKKSYPLNYNRIDGYGRPKYDSTNNSSSNTTSNSSSNTSSSSPSNLKNGSKGNAVKTLQSNLNKVMKSELVVDGQFNAKTESVVKAFQKRYGLVVDGVYGPKSQVKMTEVLKSLNKKSITEIAKEVLEGKWSSGDDRKKKLESAGYKYSEVQNKVNELSKSSKKS